MRYETAPGAQAQVDFGQVRVWIGDKRVAAQIVFWDKQLGDTAAVTALLDRLLLHAHAIICGPRSWRTKLHGATDPSVTPTR